MVARTNVLKKNTLGVPGIVFLVMAAVAPLTVLIVVIPLAVALGNGGGIPAAFVILTIILLLHVAGFSQMAKVIISAGGFYAFVVKGLGRVGGIVTGFVAAIGYNFFVIGNIASSGFFFALVISHLTGLSLPWYLWGLILLWLSFVAARYGVRFSANVLGIGLGLEVLTVLIFDVGVFLRTGFAIHAFSATAVFETGSLPIGLLLVSTAFLGFEATAIYGEEAREPRKTVPIATYVSVLAIGILFTVTSWAVVSAAGVAEAQGVAQHDLASGSLIFTLAAELVGHWLANVMRVLVLVSLAAATLAFHNAASRYLFALGRARVLPRALGRITKSGNPSVALLVQAALSTIVALLLVWLARIDPMNTMLPVFIGFGTLCIVALQMAAALAIVVWFRRVRDRRWWRTFLAPAVAFVCLLWITIMVMVHFNVVSGSQNALIDWLPALLGIAIIAGLVRGCFLKWRRPVVYQGLLADIERL